MITSAAMETDDIRMMMAYLKRMQPGEEDNQPASTSAPAKPMSPTKAQKPVKAAEQPVVSDAAYWMEKGQLAATYGAYAPAINYYKKALAMGSEESRVYFNMGIAYGELGEFAQALDYLSRAIQMASEKGAYYYGRGRVYLISGNKHMAMEDFKRAAELGDLDATQYVEGTGASKE
jgi:tetratricopeptide (TPR) repeat protein